MFFKKIEINYHPVSILGIGILLLTNNDNRINRVSKLFSSTIISLSITADFVSSPTGSPKIHAAYLSNPAR